MNAGAGADADADPDLDPRELLRRVYERIDGFEISLADARTVERSRGSATYGELMPTATLRLLSHLELGPRDCFVDLGAGVGKVVLLAVLCTPVGRAVGVELSPTRARLAERALARARELGLSKKILARVSLIEGDMMRVPLSEATVIYTCSTSFSDAFMVRLAQHLAALPRLRKIASLQPFEDAPAGFELIEIYKLDASWKRRTKVYVYARTTADEPV